MPDRSEKAIHRDDIDTNRLYDEVHDEPVEVVEKCVGCVYLRYPHQEEKQLYKCDCGEVVTGLDALERHAKQCEKADETWFDLLQTNSAKAAQQGDWFERTDLERFRAESYSYEWPLDGHRFTVVSEE